MLERDLLRLLYEDPSKLDEELARLGLRRRTSKEVDHRRNRPDYALVMSLRGEDEFDKTLRPWEPGVSLWHADHQKPVFEGGGSVGPEGIQTLCWVCHREKTAAEATRRAKANKVPPPQDLFSVDPNAPADDLFEL